MVELVKGNVRITVRKQSVPAFKKAGYKIVKKEPKDGKG